MKSGIVLIFTLLSIASFPIFNSQNQLSASVELLETDDCSTTSIWLPIVQANHVVYFDQPWEQEPNDSYQTANGPLLSGADYKGYPNDERDFFSFYLAVDGQITINLRDISGQNVQLLLYNINRSTGEPERLIYDYEAPFIITYNGIAGWYYILVFTASGQNSDTPYTLQVTYPDISPSPTSTLPTPTSLPTCTPTNTPTPTTKSEQWCDNFNDGQIDQSKWQLVSNGNFIYEQDGVLNFQITEEQSQPNGGDGRLHAKLLGQQVSEVSFIANLVSGTGTMPGAAGAATFLDDGRDFKVGIGSGVDGPGIEFSTCRIAPCSDYSDSDHLDGIPFPVNTPVPVKIVWSRDKEKFYANNVLYIEPSTNARPITRFEFYMYADPGGAFHLTVDDLCITYSQTPVPTATPSNTPTSTATPTPTPTNTPDLSPSYLVTNFYVPAGSDYHDENPAKFMFDPGYSANCHIGATCYKVSWLPDLRDWVGLYWIHPSADAAGGWSGAGQPGCNLSGATRVTFWARGEKGGEAIQVKAALNNHIEVESDLIHLTANWAEYKLDVSTADLTNVVGAFGWYTFRAENTGQVVFYLDDIRYRNVDPALVTCTTPIPTAQAGYNFETDTENWTTAEGGFKPITLTTTTQFVYSGIRAFQLEPDLRSDSSEVYLHTETIAYFDNAIPEGFSTPGPYDLTGKSVSCLVYLPSELVSSGDPYTYIRLFVKDKDFHNQFGNTVEVVSSNADQWIPLSLIVGESGFDATKTNALGIRIELHNNANFNYTGPIYIDHCMIEHP